MLIGFGLLICLCNAAMGQTDHIQVQFVTVYDSKPVAVTGEAIVCPDQYRIDMFKFYVGHFSLKDKSGNNVIEDSTYYLVNMLDSNSTSLSLSIPERTKADSISFNFGTDSLTNVSGILDGDLDPTLGMYWTWQSGYINFKLEGTHPKVTNHEHRFQYHVGGYMPPFATVNKATLSFAHSKQLKIYIHLNQIMNHLNLKEDPEILSPGIKAKKLSSEIVQAFSSEIN